MTSGSSPALEIAASIWGVGLGGVVLGGIKSTYISSERTAVESPDLCNLGMDSLIVAI